MILSLPSRFEIPMQSNESEEVVILVHQDPIYEMVVAHYYSCATDTANKVLMVGALTSSTIPAIFSPLDCLMPLPDTTILSLSQAILGENALAARQREDSGHNPFATEASNDEAPRGPLVSLEVSSGRCVPCYAALHHNWPHIYSVHPPPPMPSATSLTEAKSVTSVGWEPASSGWCIWPATQTRAAAAPTLQLKCAGQIQAPRIRCAKASLFSSFMGGSSSGKVLS